VTRRVSSLNFMEMPCFRTQWGDDDQLHWL